MPFKCNADRAANRRKHRASTSAVAKERHHRLRAEAIIAYGGKCVCCGESQTEFLAFDHVSGGGADDRRRGITGLWLHTRLKKRGYPSTHQLLCHNCNHSKGAGSICNHDQLDGLVVTGTMFNQIWANAANS